LRDLHRLYTGPGYANRYSTLAKKAGVQIRTNTSVLEWISDNTLLTTSPEGLCEINAKAVLLATGCRERPRAARLVPGYRAAGVFTTGALQDFVHGYHQRVGHRAVIIGAELVSFSAVMTLRKAGCKIVRMVTEQAHHQAYGLYSGYKMWAADILQRVPISTRCQVAEIQGQKRVQSITVRNLDSGAVESIACDTVIFSGDWIPDSELARKAGLTMDAGSKGPVIDHCYRTQKPGVFAAGNVLRGAETADIAALEGRKAAAAMDSYLAKESWPKEGVPIQHDAHITWIVPAMASAIDPNLCDRPILFRVKEFVKNGRVRVQQGDRLLHEQSFAKLGPNYSFSLANRWLGDVQRPGPEVKVTLER
jgi:NADPH-dependent 2,4-dienoyl-CoA reductase/sulfur reductase-like enzyme